MLLFSHAGAYLLDMLTQIDNVPFNLYPFVHLLPSGLLFIFAGQLSVLLDYKLNRVTGMVPPPFSSLE